eukprot:Hpha_TRINITY_DN15350_c3_g2::TRINITY_DN15350_c3_g2_i1::g.88831::m.88831
MFATLSLGLAVGTMGGVPATMRAVQVEPHVPWLGCKAPDWDCLTTKVVDTPVPTKDQILIRVEGSSMNPVNADIVMMPCRILPVPFGCPHGLTGMEAAGTVVQMGEGQACKRFKLGDEVWGGALGGFAEYAVLECNMTGIRPAGLSPVDAGTVPVTGTTALECLRKTGAPWAKKNLTVVITSGSGGTGYIAIQLAKALGAGRVVTAASGAGIDMVKSLGADLVVDYKKQEIFDALPNNSVDIVFDNFGAKGTADKAMHAIRPGGVYLVLFGGGLGKISKNPKPGVEQITFRLVNMSSHEPLDTLAGLFEEGKLKPHTQHIYGLDQIRQAFNASWNGGALGKLAVSPLY